MAEIGEDVRKGLELVALSQAQSHAFLMERSKIVHLDGVMTQREGITHRIIAESGGGQARAQLPGGMGGVPTVVPKS